VNAVAAVLPVAPAPRRDVDYLGLAFDPRPLGDIVDALLQPIAACVTVVTPNVDHLVRLHRAGRDALLWPAYHDATLRLCDSRVVARLARLQGVDLPVVPGSDLTARLFERLQPGDKIAVIGGDTQTCAELAARRGDIAVVQHIPPMGMLRNPAAMAAAVDFIVAAQARFIFLAVGSPQQELLAMQVRAVPAATRTIMDAARRNRMAAPAGVEPTAAVATLSRRRPADLRAGVASPADALTAPSTEQRRNLLIAVADHLQCDIDDHGQPEETEPAVTVDVPGDQVRRQPHQRHRQYQPDDQDFRMLARGPGDREHVVEAHRNIRHCHRPCRGGKALRYHRGRYSGCGDRLAKFAPHFPRDPQQQPAREDQPEQVQQLSNAECKYHSQPKRRTDADQDDAAALLGRQPGRQRADDDRIVGGEHEIDQHDLAEHRQLLKHEFCDG